MFCQSCGAANDNDDQFCGQCGSLLKGSAPQAQGWSGLPTSRSPLPDTQYTPAGVVQDWQAPTMAVPPPTWMPQPGYGNPSLAPSGWRTPPPDGAAPLAQPAAVPAKRRRRWPAYFLLFLLIFGAGGVGGWILFLRPAIHRSVDGEIQQGLQRAVDQIPFDAARDAPSGYPVLITEDQMNSYLDQNSAELAPITSMHISLEEGVMVVTFQAYGFGSTVRLGLGIQNGGSLIAQKVEVSGLLAWVETAQELMQRLNSALSQVTINLGRPLADVAIQTDVLTLTLA